MRPFEKTRIEEKGGYDAWMSWRAAKEQEDNSKWLSLIRQYADIKELDREMLHLLIKEIVVHEDMSEGRRNTTVEIHFNFMKQGNQLTVKS